MTSRSSAFLGLVPPATLGAGPPVGDAHIYLTVPFLLGWSMMDALACGAVVIGSDTEPVREMITPGENGLLVDFFDAKAIAEQTLEVLRTPSAFEPIRRNAVRFVRQRYSLDVALPKMIALYRSAMRVRSAERQAFPGLPRRRRPDSPVTAAYIRSSHMTMSVYWDYVIEPMLAAIKARTVVEIGALNGDTTERLLTFAREHGP